jgi:hypothetical protein
MPDSAYTASVTMYRCQAQPPSGLSGTTSMPQSARGIGDQVRRNRSHLLSNKYLTGAHTGQQAQAT